MLAMMRLPLSTWLPPARAGVDMGVLMLCLTRFWRYEVCVLPSVKNEPALVAKVHI